MAAEKSTETQNPVRFRATRKDATFLGITRRIERDFKLPEGSVRDCAPE